MAMSLYTIEDAARHLGVTPKTVRNLIKAGHLTVHKREKDRHKYCDPAEVEELREERSRGHAVVVRREEFAILRGQVKRLQAMVDVLVRILDSKDATLGVTKEYGEQLYALCVEQLQMGAWTPAEMSPWVEVFLRLDEDDLGKISDATQDPKPWIPFLRLVSAMIASSVGDKNYTTSLELQTLHRQLAEARKRLRASALIYAEIRGYSDSSIDKYREFSIPSSALELLEKVMRKKSGKS